MKQQRCRIGRESGFWDENTKLGFELLDLAQFAFGAIPLVFSVQMPPFGASPPPSQDDPRVPSGPTSPYQNSCVSFSQEAALQVPNLSSKSGLRDA